MFDNTLPLKAKKLLEKFSTFSWIKKYYLAGGTALALQYGHRQSVDLDWFIDAKINTKILLKKLVAIGKFELLNEDKNTLEGILDGVKVSFMSYPYPLLERM